MLDFKETVWSYITSKIDLLTNVKSDQLKFGMTSLNLENLDIKTENMEIPRTKINNMVIKNLKLELNFTSLAVYVSGVSIDATVESLDNTDQLAESLVDETFNSLANDENIGDSGVLATLKSQLLLVVKDVDITLELVGCPSLINLSVGKVAYKGLKNLEIEDLCGYAANDDSEVVFINRALRSDNGDTSIDLIRFNPVSTINLLFPVINGLLSQPSSSQGHSNAPLKVFIQKLFVMGLSQQLVLERILFNSNLSIEVLSFGSILNAAPFLDVKLGDTVEATVLSPLDLHLEYKDLPCLKADIESLVDCFSNLVIPEAPEPAKFNIWLPNIRLSLENNLVIHIFVNLITERCIDVAEIMLTAPNNQLVVRSIIIESTDFTVESVRGKLNSELNGQITEIQSVMGESKAEQTSEPCLPHINLVLKSYSLSFENHYLEGGVEFNTTNTHELRITSAYNSQGIQCEGVVSMKKSPCGQWTGGFITERLICNLDNLTLQNNDSESTPKPLHIPQWLDFSLNCELRNVSLLTRNKTLFVSLQPINITGNSDLNVTLPYLSLKIDEIPLLDVANLSLNVTSNSLKIGTEEVTLSCCADTFSFLKTINIATSSSGVDVPETQALTQVNVFEGIDVDMFSATQMTLTSSSGQKHNLQIINSADIPIFQLEILFSKINLMFHDGYDFKDVQTTLAHEYKATNNESELLYNSIIIDKTEPIEPNASNPPSEFKRSPSGVCIQLNHLGYTNSIYESRSITDFSITEGKIIDQISGSVYENVLKSTSSGGKDFTFLMTTKEKESRLSLGIKPLELNLDQYTLEFLLRFFQFESSDSVNESFEEVAISPQQDVFFQKVRINPLKLKVNYAPKKMNYRNLRAGHAQELINLFAVENATLKLCEIKLYGVSGWVGVFDLAANKWWPDIYKHQLGGLFTSLSPLRLVVRASLKVTKSSTAKVARTAYRKFIS